MKAGIIAAGEGSRFRGAGVDLPKPVIEVAGRPLIDHVLRGLVAAGVVQIAIIVNAAGEEILSHVRGLALPVALKTLSKDTSGSFASLAEIAKLIGDDRFVVSTVDTVAPPAEVGAFVDSFATGGMDALLAYTDFVDDEKPLRIALADGDRVSALGEGAAASPFVTAGLYGFGRRAAAELRAAEHAGIVRLRDFLALLPAQGLDVRGKCLGKAIDVDRPGDVRVAEAFLAELETARCA